MFTSISTNIFAAMLLFYWGRWKERQITAIQLNNKKNSWIKGFGNKMIKSKTARKLNLKMSWRNLSILILTFSNKQKKNLALWNICQRMTLKLMGYKNQWKKKEMKLLKGKTWSQPMSTSTLKTCIN